MRIFAGIVAAVGCAAVAASTVAVAQEKAVPAVQRTQFIELPTDMRGHRFCQVMPVFRTRLSLRVDVYNSTGMNDCPDILWSQLNEDQMKREYGATQVVLNGPRYWVVNELIAPPDTVAGRIGNFRGIEMRRVATIEMGLLQGMLGDKIYADNKVSHATAFVYAPGTRVYELVSPRGHVYRMQSFSHLIDNTLTFADLDTLGQRLKLPRGWRYQVRDLTEPSVLLPSEISYVINDDLYNSYQRIVQ